MTIPNNFELANDSEFRLLANFTTPPRAGRVTVIEPSGQVRVATDDPDGGDVLAWPLNGFTYAVNDVVYIAFAANNPDTAIVIGAKAPLPRLDAAALPEPYVPTDGSDPLTADWDIGEDRRILAEALRARDGEGLRLEDDAGNLGIFVEDGGQVGIGTTSPVTTLHVVESAAGVAQIRVTNNAGSVGDYVIYNSADSGTVFGNSPRGNMTSFANTGGKFALGTAHAYDLIFGTNATERERITSAGLHGIGVSAPQGKFHIHDGTGGLLFVTKSAISNVAQTIIPNATGDVTGGITGFFVVSSGGSAVANSFTMLPGDNLDIVVGGYTLRLALNANGALTTFRQAGSGTATLMLFGVWL